MTPEGKLQKKCLKLVEELKRAGVPIKAVKYHSEGHGRAGTPDVHVTYRGHSSWLELKAPGNEPTERQLMEQEEWRTAGGTSMSIWTLCEFADALGLTLEDREHLPKWASKPKS